MEKKNNRKDNLNIFPPNALRLQPCVPLRRTLVV